MRLFSPTMSKLQNLANMIFTRSLQTNGEAVGCAAQMRAISVVGVKGRWHARRELLPHTWRAACSLILVTAAVLRLYHLSLKPLHHDEGVNAYFLGRLLRQGIYQYDPANYHGPTLYYFALLISSFIEMFSRPNELTTVAIRLVPALFGIATVALLLGLRKQVGDIGVLAAAALLAVSPAAVYFSRDFIHEALLVFFTLAVPMTG